MVIEQDTPFIEFQEGSPEAIAMAKVEPILGRPMAYHTLVEGDYEGDFERFVQAVGDVLRTGLYASKILGRRPVPGELLEHVYSEITRHQQRFEPKAKVFFTPAPESLSFYYGLVIEELTYRLRSKVSSGLGTSTGVAFLLDREAIEDVEGTDDGYMIGKTFERVPPDRLKGLVVLSPVSGFSIDLDSEVIRQLRKDQLSSLEENWQRPAKIFEELFEVADEFKIGTIVDYTTDEFAATVMFRKHQSVIEELLEQLHDPDILKEYQERAALECSQSSESEHDKTERAGYTVALGCLYLGKNPEDAWGEDYSFDFSHLFKGKPLGQFDQDVLREWTVNFTLLMLTKIYLSMREITDLLNYDNGDFRCIIGFGEDHLRKILTVRNNSGTAIPVYDCFGNLLLPQKMPFDHIKESWLANRPLV